MAEAALPSGFLTIPIAHRALHDRDAGRIENSPSAIAAALAAGYGIEIDVQLSRDGIAMVFHDDVLDRLTAETGPVKLRDAAELAGFALKGSKDHIPTLAQVLAQVAGRVPLLIEVKDQDGALGPAESGIENAVARDLNGYAGPVALMSFNPHVIARLAGLVPGVPRGLVTDGYVPGDWTGVPEARKAELARIADFDRVGAGFVSHNRKYLDMAPVAALKARGVPVLTWTVRSSDQEAEARMVADNITFEGYLAPLS